MGDPVMSLQQCAVECLDRLGISEVDRLSAHRMRHEKWFQFRAAPNQPGEIIGPPVLVPRMELPFGMVGFGSGFQILKR